MIAANGGDGVRMLADADGNSVFGNWIGTDAGATLDLGNGGSGVDIDGGDANRVGEPDEPTPMNTIAHNGDDGVTVTSGTDNAILPNAISANDELGIDLGANGATANDPKDARRRREQPPERPGDRERADDRRLGARERAEHALPARVLRQRHVRRPGRRRGPDLPRLDGLTTDANGDADGSTRAAAGVRPGKRVSMTATRAAFSGLVPNVFLVPFGTSEFSPCEEVE